MNNMWCRFDSRAADDGMIRVCETGVSNRGVAALQAVPAHAERDPVSGAPIKPEEHRMTPSPITDRFAVEGIFFNPAVSTNLRIDSQGPGFGAPGISGTPISGERDFGLDSRIPQGRIEIIFRLRQNNRLRVDYFATDRSGDHVINRTILFGDETFVANDRVTSNLDWRQFALTYTYSLFRNDYVEAGVGLGVHFLEADGRGRGECQAAPSGSVGLGGVSHDPVGYHLAYLAWARIVCPECVHASVNNFAGSIAEYHGDLQWRWRRYPKFSGRVLATPSCGRRSI